MKHRKIAGSPNTSVPNITIGKLHRNHSQHDHHGGTTNLGQRQKKRIMNYKLVQVQGVPKEIALAKVLTMYNYFGRYGTISNLYVTESKSSQGKKSEVMNAYVTYQSQINSSLALLGVHNTEIKGFKITANYGTNRYCQSFLDGEKCQKQKCFYLHFLDQENDAMNPIHSRERHLEKAFSIVVKNLRQVISLEMEENTQSENSSSKFRTIHNIIQRLIKKGVIDTEEYEKIRKKGKFTGEKIVKLKKSMIEMGSSKNIKDVQQKVSEYVEFPFKFTNSMVLCGFKTKDFPIENQSTVESSQLSRDSSSKDINEMIRDKILVELKKRRGFSRLQFAKKLLLRQCLVSYPSEDEESKLIRQKMKKSLLQN